MMSVNVDSRRTQAILRLLLKSRTRNECRCRSENEKCVILCFLNNNSVREHHSRPDH